MSNTNPAAAALEATATVTATAPAAVNTPDVVADSWKMFQFLASKKVAGEVAKDIARYGAPVIGALEAVENLVPHAGASAPLQAGIAVAVAVVTALVSSSRQ